MMTAAVPTERFQAIARRNGEIRKHASPIHLDQLAQGHPGDRSKPTIPFLMEKLLRVPVCE